MNRSIAVEGQVDEFRKTIVRKTESLARKKLGDEPTGHDWWHAERVRATALDIARHEGADLFVIDLAALLHDIEDFKFSGSEESGPRFAVEWLLSMSVDNDVAEHVAEIIKRMSFKGANVRQLPLSLEGQCLQDADRLDALGAIGIARVFAFGGHRGRPIHDPGVEPVMHSSAQSYMASVGTSVNHFHEKLLLLRDRMNTPRGRALADERHEFMVQYLDRFHAEWKGSA